MYGYPNIDLTDEQIEELSRMNNVAQTEQAPPVEAPPSYETTIRSDKDRFKTLARQLGLLSDPKGINDYGDKIKSLVNEIPQGRVTQQQMQDVADKRAGISFLTNPGRSMFYGNGQATDVTPYSIEGNRKFGEELMNRANVPLEYADKLRKYNSEDMKKLEGAQALELNEMDKKTKAASGLVEREKSVQALKTKMDMDDPNSQISKDAAKIFQAQLDAQIAENEGDARPRYRNLSQQMKAAKLAASGASYNQIQGLMAKDTELYKRVKEKVDQDIKEKYGEEMAASAGIRANAAMKQADLPKHEEMVLIKDMNRLKSTVDAMGELGKMKSNVNTGILEGPVKSALSKLGVEYNDMVELKAGIARIFNRETKEIAGVAVSPSEWARIEPSLPKYNDDDDVFMTKLKKAIIETQRLLDDKVDEYEIYKGKPIDLNKYKARIAADPEKMAHVPPPPAATEKTPGYHGDIVQQNGVSYKWSIKEKKYKPASM